MRTALVLLLLAQAPIGKAELALAREKLERSKEKLSKEQWALLNGKLAEAEAALAELTAARGETAVAAAEGSAAVWATLEALPLFLMLMPATAYAPGMKESPAKLVARTRYEDKLRELAQAAQLIESQQAKPPPDNDQDCKPIGEGGASPVRYCKYECGDQRYCVTVTGGGPCPENRGKKSNKIKFLKLSGFPRCPPNQFPN